MSIIHQLSDTYESRLFRLREPRSFTHFGAESMTTSHSVNSTTATTEHPGRVVWLTGFSGAGKTTLALALKQELINAGRHAVVLDGDVLRRGLCSDLGFSPEHRRENIRRVGEVASLFASSGAICIAAFISPYRRERDLARSVAPQGRFLEIHLSTPLEVCEQRDTKGLYAKARAGKLADFTGISSPYEPPPNPEIVLRTDLLDVSQCVAMILRKL
jgi:adenylyl-sulfate kinase